jgi:hypothetical protein
MLSDEAAQCFDSSSCDFIYLDANHSYLSTKSDLASWYPKLRKGGVMAGHDYFDARADKQGEPIFFSHLCSIPKEDLTSFGVKSAVDEFAEKLDVRICVTNEPLPSWYFTK